MLEEGYSWCFLTLLLGPVHDRDRIEDVRLDAPSIRVSGAAPRYCAQQALQAAIDRIGSFQAHAASLGSVVDFDALQHGLVSS